MESWGACDVDDDDGGWVASSLPSVDLVDWRLVGLASLVWFDWSLGLISWVLAWGRFTWCVHKWNVRILSE